MSLNMRRILSVLWGETEKIRLFLKKFVKFGLKIISYVPVGVKKINSHQVSESCAE